MSQYLAYGGFQWFNQKDIDKFDINSIKEDKVDLEYPDELHVLHDYPLAPEKLEISDNMLSNYCSEIAKKYTVHYRNLQQHLSLGMKFTKVHRVLKFKQSDWLKKYIDFNTDKRKNAANSFEKDFFKLIINSAYGRTVYEKKNKCQIG